MQAAILIVSISSGNYLTGTISIVMTMESERTKQENISAQLIEEMISQELMGSNYGKTSVLTVFSSKSCRKDYSKINYHKCENFGCIVHYCRSKQKPVSEKQIVRKPLALERLVCSSFVFDSVSTQHLFMN